MGATEGKVGRNGVEEARPERRVTFQNPHAAYLDECVTGAQAVIRDGVAKGTQARYQTGFRHWQRFIARVVSHPRPQDYLPAHLAYGEVLRLLLAFVYHLSQTTDMSARSIASALTGVQYEFRSRLISVEPFSDPLLTQFKKGISRQREPSTRVKGSAAPFTVRMVHHAWEYSVRNPEPKYRVAALGAMLGYFNMMRPSEFCVTENSEHTIRAAAVEFEVSGSNGQPALIPAYQVAQLPEQGICLESVRITWWSAKNLSFGETRTAWFSVLRPDQHGLCLASKLYDWAKIACYRSREDFFLSYPVDLNNLAGERYTLDYRFFNEVVKSVAKAFGLDPKFFSAHSPRVGAPTQMLAQGASDAAILLGGGWKSVPVGLHYAKQTTRSNDAQLHMLQQLDAISVRDLQMRMQTAAVPPKGGGGGGGGEKG